jgi:hypothetical protein
LKTGILPIKYTKCRGYGYCKAAELIARPRSVGADG